MQLRPLPVGEERVWLPDHVEDLPVQRHLLQATGGVETKPLVYPRLTEIAVDEEGLNENDKEIVSLVITKKVSFRKYIWNVQSCLAVHIRKCEDVNAGSIIYNKI